MAADPRVIAIDTSRSTGSVAVLVAAEAQPRVVFEETFASRADHARLLAPAVGRGVRASGGPLAAGDLLAVVTGPGSFTGLRVGVTTAKLLAWSSDAALVAVSGFEILARAAAAWLAEEAGRDGPAAGPLQLAFAAGRGEVYAAEAVTQADHPGGWRCSEPVILDAGQWAAGLPGGANVAVGSPESAGAIVELFSGRDDLLRVPPQAVSTSATDAGRLGLLRAAAGCLDDPAGVVPDYLRPSYAEEPKAAGVVERRRPID